MTSLERLGRRAPRFGYLPALDGLRAVAILAVIAQHSGIAGLHGYHGVTLFLVISGYLITRLLLQERASTGRIALKRFYARRFARLGPALVVVILATAAWLSATGVPVASYWAGVVGSLTYSTDLIEAVSGNSAVGSTFQWSWSLGVEELFYLFWPVALLLMVKWRRFTWSAAVLIAGIAGCWILRSLLIAMEAGHNRYFFAPDTNADALLLGALVAFIVVRHPHSPALKIAGQWAGPIGLLGLIALTWPYLADPITQFDKGSLGLTALASAAVLLWMATAPDSRAAALLSLPPLVFIGRLSYGIYLWNMLTIVVFTTLTGEQPAQSAMGVVWLIGLGAIAYVSWRFVETPLRDHWSRARPDRVAIAPPAQAFDARSEPALVHTLPASATQSAKTAL
ncbi:acyltransferase [Cryobacterium algoritolerans]|uniref:Acyltransferase n=1 Tax=Cryobacterium algoritolerans TaxID=1259184 RepID=A0A4V6QGW8_9MICO|nr:acyltransferase [Cryobacterium algoritolerans]TFC10418.1 acyltransferase [Cryobacterium algoritolerans]